MLLSYQDQFRKGLIFFVQLLLQTYIISYTSNYIISI